MKLEHSKNYNKDCLLKLTGVKSESLVNKIYCKLYIILLYSLHHDIAI